MSHPVPPEKRTPKCAQCKNHPVNADYCPFCSRRCADVDLNQWLKGGYAIPGSPAHSASIREGADNSEED